MTMEDTRQAAGARVDKRIDLLWTGGWDSTYRMAALSRMDLAVQPIYCCDPGRDSIEIEKRAMERIWQALVDRETTRARFYPIRYVDIGDIPPNEEITRAYREIGKTVRIGTQYEWLARLAVEYPGIELGIVATPGPPSGCPAAIAAFGRLKTENGVKVADPLHSTNECMLVFGNYSYPLIDISETDMLRNIREWGFEDIMRMIWFCHTPSGGRPCGMCSPCRQKMEGGMESLLPKAARNRYHAYMRVKRCFGEEAAERMGRLYGRIAR